MADTKVEYRVREVTRYIVTRHYEDLSGTHGGTETKGEFDNSNVAFEVAYALCKDEHSRLGYPLDDMRIIYPDPIAAHPKPATAHTVPFGTVGAKANAVPLRQG